MFRVAIVACLLGLVFAAPSVVRSRADIEKFRSFLESTKTDDGRFLTRVALNPRANPEALSGKYQGDILLNDFTIESMLQQYAMGRNAYIFPGTKWPNNTVIWEFGEGEFDPLQKAAIEEGIKAIEDHTCLKFRQRRPEETDFVQVTGDADGCYADIGYWESGGVHIVNLARDGCLYYTTIVHEWLHAIGFFHMHSTYNRNEYVRIAIENVMPGNEYNFDVYSTELLSNLGVEYEYVSVMHYEPYAFSSNGEPTIIALKEFEGEMGQRDYVTDSDWLRVNRHYNCPGAWD